MLLEKELATVEQAPNGFLSAIAAGIVTKSTKERMLSLEAQKEELENKIELEKQQNIPPLKNTKPYALFFTILQIRSTSRTKKRTSFSIRLSIVWFCLTIISTFFTTLRPNIRQK